MTPVACAVALVAEPEPRDPEPEARNPKSVVCIVSIAPPHSHGMLLTAPDPLTSTSSSTPCHLSFNYFTSC